MTTELIKHFKDINYKIEDLIELSEKYRSKAFDKYKELDIRYCDKIPEIINQDQNLIFHIVDKDQRAGGREI